MSEPRADYVVSTATIVATLEPTVTLVTSRRWAWLLTRAQTLLKDCDEVAIRKNPMTGHLEIGALIAFENHD